MPLLRLSNGTTMSMDKNVFSSFFFCFDGTHMEGQHIISCVRLNIDSKDPAFNIY